MNLQALTATIPLATIVLIGLFGYALACVRGFREALFGQGQEGRLKLMNILSIEGATAVLVVGLLLGFGVYYPVSLLFSNELARIPELEQRAKQAAELREKLELATERLEAVSNPTPWTITGRFRIDMEAGLWQRFEENQPTIAAKLGNRSDARDFWHQGVFFVIPKKHRLLSEEIIEPRRGRSVGVGFDTAKYELTLNVPRGRALDEHIEVIIYEHPLIDGIAELVFADPGRPEGLVIHENHIRYPLMLLRSPVEDPESEP